MAIHQDNIVMKALEVLVVDGIDMGATFEPLVFSAEMNVQDIGNETSLTPIDSEITSRLFSAEVTLAEVKLSMLAVILNLPTTNIVSSSSMLMLDYADRDMMTWLAVGKTGSATNGGVRTFNFPKSRSVGTPTYNLAKLEATNLPVQFNFYANRTTGVAGTITDTESFFMLYDTARTSQIDLGGSAVSEAIYTAINQLHIPLIRVIYDEATSAHTGVAIRVGIYGAPNYFSTFTSEINKSISERTSLSIGQNGLLPAGETLIVECDGGKTGTGAITVQVELEAWT